jgi:hypothetical protein
MTNTGASGTQIQGLTCKLRTRAPSLSYVLLGRNKSFDLIVIEQFIRYSHAGVHLRWLKDRLEGITTTRPNKSDETALRWSGERNTIHRLS